MTLKAICECSTCACGNAPGRSGYCLNCEVTDSGSEGSHAQPETPGPIDWSTVEASRAIRATWNSNPRHSWEANRAYAEIVRRWDAYDTMKEALREAADSLSNSLKRITLIDGGITDENEELYYAGIAALDNATDAFAGADRCTITATGRAALAAAEGK